MTTTLQKRADDEKALTAILDCLRYAERELRLLSVPMRDTADLTSLAARCVERELAPRSDRIARGARRQVQT